MIDEKMVSVVFAVQLLSFAPIWKLEPGPIFQILRSEIIIVTQKLISVIMPEQVLMSGWIGFFTGIKFAPRRVFLTCWSKFHLG
jgi:hypothetical protein